MKRYARSDEGLPLTSSNYLYDESISTTAWDSDMIFACLCDSSWTVGLDSGETQLAEYFGPSCSNRRCPSGDDPRTTSAMDPIGTYTASWSATTLTVSAVTTGAITVGQRISATGITSGTFVSAFLTGTGGVGTYTLSASQSSNSGTVNGLFHYTETDCEGVIPTGGVVPGAAGNLCHVDCSNRGHCDYATGTCRCFSSYFGSNCGTFSQTT
jgi:hypothetical protein